MSLSSKFEFKGYEYNLADLIHFRNKSPMYKNGDVLDKQTGEVKDIQEIDE